MLTTLVEIYEALDGENIEITCSEDGLEWFWRDVDTSEEGPYTYTTADEAAIAAAEEFGFQHNVELDFDHDPGFDYYDDGMDGDHASALASAGFGTDEDYGFFGDEGDW